MTRCSPLYKLYLVLDQFQSLWYQTEISKWQIAKVLYLHNVNSY